MYSKRTRPLDAAFSEPTPANIAWSDVESPLVSVGRQFIEGARSRVTFVFNDHVESFHRPDPAKEAKLCQVKQAKTSSAKIGVPP